MRLAAAGQAKAGRYLGLISGSALLLLAVTISFFEFMLRRDPDVQVDLAYRRAHCLEDRFVLLCPDVRTTLRAGTRIFDLNTDAHGYRLVPRGQSLNIDRSDQSQKHSFIVFGDSLSMGYGLHDEESLPALLQAGGHCVVNLAVDSLGPTGMEYVLKKFSAEQSPADIWPDSSGRLYVWVFSPSDFTDEEKLLRMNSRWYRVLYAVHFHLQRYLALYGYLRGRPMPVVGKDLKEATLAGADLPASDHPALLSMDRLFSAYRPLMLVFYPSAPQADMDLERMVAERARAQGVKVLWLESVFRTEIARYPERQDELYLPADGHPGPEAARIFARAILDAIKTESKEKARSSSRNR